jgi:hypothetical protein
MSDSRFQPDLTIVTLPDISRPFLPLPLWVARRLLRSDETITWVVGPRFNPAWERYVTHPALFLVALAIGVVLVAVGRLCSESWTVMPPLAIVAVMAGPALVLGSVFVLGISAAYFTRLVVTNHRLVIIQGYEVCRSWGLNELPPSLVRYGPRRTGDRERHVDLDALQTMLGNVSDRFADSKTIIAFGKHLDQIKSDKDRRS